MIKLKNPEEIEIMGKGGKVLWEILLKLEKYAKPGITTLNLDREAERLIKKAGGEPSFKKVPNYRFSTCLCVNDVVVHGIPTSYQLRDGDILGIDVGLLYRGFHTDVASSIIVGEENKTREYQKKINFLKTGKEALAKAISLAREDNHVGDISRAIQEIIEREGFSVVRVLVGHGIGRQLHEDPQIPGYLPQSVEKTPMLKKGMVLAIEVIYNLGGSQVAYRDDGWTIATYDGQISGLFEKTVAVTERGPIVLTQ